MGLLKRIDVNKKEAFNFLISILVLGFIFSYRMWYSLSEPEGIRKSLINFSTSIIIVGISVLVYVLANKILARSYECKSDYKLLPRFLLASLGMTFLTNGNIPFAAVGCMTVSTAFSTRLGFQWAALSSHEEGRISFLGLLSNIILAFLFKILSPLLGGDIASLGIRVNTWFALFNSLPIPPLNGSKVLMFSRILYLGLIIIDILSLIVLPALSPLLTFIIILLTSISLFIFGNLMGF